MSQFPSPHYRREPQPLDYAPAATGAIGTFFNAVYAWMCVGLATTAVVAWWVSGNESLMRSIFSGGTFIILILAELGLVFAISYAVNKISAPAATALFVLYSALNGLTLSVILIVYPLGTIGMAFFATAGMFGAMSLVGFVTKRDLSGLGSILFMALLGLIIASVINIFVASTAFDWFITYALIAVFLGLTVYDTQKLKQIAYATEGNHAMAARMAIVGSLALYLDFINLFLLILRVLGRSRD